MIETVAVPRRWGNSLGVTFPKEVVERAHLVEDKPIKILILSQDRSIERSFGTLKLKKSGQEIKDEIRRDLHG